jgi:hypothetical protein
LLRIGNVRIAGVTVNVDDFVQGWVPVAVSLDIFLGLAFVVTTVNASVVVPACKKECMLKLAVIRCQIKAKIINE